MLGECGFVDRFTTKEDRKRDYRVSDDNKPWRDELGYWPETLRLCCSAVSKVSFV